MTPVNPVNPVTHLTHLTPVTRCAGRPDAGLPPGPRRRLT